MQKIDHLVHTKHIITCEENNRVLENHALAIHAGKILAILPSEEAKQKYQADKEDNYSDHIVMPGLINCHTHIAMNVFRGLADDLPLMEWLQEHIWPAESKWVSEELVADASQLAMAEMIKGGTTCFNDMYFFLGATAKAAEIAGMRAHIGMTVITVPTAWAKTVDDYFAKGIEFYQQYKNHPLIVPTMAPHSTYSLDDDVLKRAKEVADQYKIKTNIHLNEDPADIAHSMQKYNKRSLQRAYEIGMVSSDLIAIHMTQITDADIEILLKTKPSIVHCPESNMKLVGGFCPVEKLTELGINVALGTDGAASNNDLDMFSEMRTAALLGKVVANDPRAVSAEKAMKMATINGAKALGIDHITGSLTAGKSADFIAINIEQIETQPLYNPVSQVVYATPRSQVTDVWVADKQLLKNRHLQTLDEKELLNKAHIWRKRIKN